MPKLELSSVLVIGSGPIVIGQAAEFDYAGTQAVRSLKEEGIRVVLVNSNPATIMTDRETADEVYLEPLTIESVKKILYRERPDAVLPTLGGQIALNLARELAEEGFFEQQNIQLLGVNLKGLQDAEDRQRFKELMEKIGEPTPPSTSVESLQQARAVLDELGLPLIIRPAYTLGGSGGGIARTQADFDQLVASGLSQSPITQCLIEKSIEGFKEIEYEIMRDANDTCIVVCNMENFDPVGIHTGDSIVFAPSQTLSDRDVQRLRDCSLKIIRALGITGGCNVQLALDPQSDQYYVIEVNPRVSRSSALASKATGYPIAKIAAKIAIGYRLDELLNPITQNSYASFEPTLDYIVTKIPRWPFDKFQKGERRLGTQMKATGEVMALGRSYSESILKAARSLELSAAGLQLGPLGKLNDKELYVKLDQQDDERLFVIAELLRRGATPDKIHQKTLIDLFFLSGLKKIIEEEKRWAQSKITKESLLRAKTVGLSDRELAALHPEVQSEEQIFSLRKQHGVFPVYKMVDTCSAEFSSLTPYFYSTYEHCAPGESENEAIALEDSPIVVLGSGPIRIGQGVEFDYATVHATQSIRAAGKKAIVINSNPETVSTDFDLSDRLYFEPLTLEDVSNILTNENCGGVITQFGGQTAINLATDLEQRGFKLLGTSLANMQKAENRQEFEEFLEEHSLGRPMGTTLTELGSAAKKAKQLGYPLMVRPSYVLGGRAMQIVYNEDELMHYLHEAVEVNPEHPVLMDRYLLGKEVEVDAICDGKEVCIPGIMEHIEKAGVHSGDSMAVYPHRNIPAELVEQLVTMTTTMAKGLGIVGLLNIQFVISKGKIFVLEVNPRSSRTVPFLSKVTGIAMAKIATRIILGDKLTSHQAAGLAASGPFVAVKAPVFSFSKLSSVEIALGPEMKSTGEVMGMDRDYRQALYKAFLAAGVQVPEAGTVLVTVADQHKDQITALLRQYHEAGFHFMATKGTAAVLRKANLPVQEVKKIGEGKGNLIDEIKSSRVHLVINTLSNARNVESDGFKVRRAAVECGIVCLTHLDSAEAFLEAIELRGQRVQALSAVQKVNS